MDCGTGKDGKNRQGYWDVSLTEGKARVFPGVQEEKCLSAVLGPPHRAVKGTPVTSLLTPSKWHGGNGASSHSLP